MSELNFSYVYDNLFNYEHPQWRSGNRSWPWNRMSGVGNFIKATLVFVRKGIRNSKCCLAPANVYG